MNDIFSRQQHKTSEGELYYELINSYNFSPKESESVIETAKKYLIRDNVLREGEIEILVIAIEERSGKMIESMKKVPVRLTMDEGKGDTEILRGYGRRELRRTQIQRISEEAIEQGGVLSQEDLSRYLRCGLRTIKRDISEIKRRGIEVITRGVLHNIGRGQTHKRRIVGLYLEGRTFSDIRIQMRHSVGSIKRYIESFIRVLMSSRHGITEIREMSSVTGLSEYLIKQYLELLEESWRDKTRAWKLRWLIKQWDLNRSKLKKSLIFDEFGRKAVPTTGGVI